MGSERRQIPDRRRTPTKPLSRYALWGHRKKSRREEEDNNYYVDWYEPRFFILISLILILCVLDAFFTLKIIDLGGRELNRFMLVFLYKKPISALVFKYMVTAAGIAFVLVHKNFMIFGRIKAGFLIYALFLIYLILGVYEAFIFFNHIRPLRLLP